MPKLKSNPSSVGSPVTLRIPSQVLQRCGWIASAKGISRSEFLRSVIKRAAKDASPPADAAAVVVEAIPDEIAQWSAAASRAGMTLNAWARQSIGRVLAAATPAVDR